jgi:dTDP-4-amino-4,6-dideoxygalactose transaminase
MIAALPFYPRKVLGALGEGGAVTTDEEKLAARVRELRNLAASRKRSTNTWLWDTRSARTSYGLLSWASRTGRAEAQVQGRGR